MTFPVLDKTGDVTFFLAGKWVNERAEQPEERRVESGQQVMFASGAGDVFLDALENALHLSVKCLDLRKLTLHFCDLLRQL